MESSILVHCVYRVAHPELTADIIKAHDEKVARWKADLAVRAKIQCLMCSFAGVKTSNMARCVIDSKFCFGILLLKLSFKTS